MLQTLESHTDEAVEYPLHMDTPESSGIEVTSQKLEDPEMRRYEIMHCLLTFQ